MSLLLIIGNMSEGLRRQNREEGETNAMAFELLSLINTAKLIWGTFSLRTF